MFNRSISIVVALSFVLVFFCKKEEVPLVTTLSEDFFVFTNTGLHLREKADRNSESLGLISRGTEVKILGKTDTKEKIEGMDGTWWNVEADGKKGFMFSAYISRYKPAKTECQSFESYLEGSIGKIEKGNGSLDRIEAKKDKACDSPEQMENCKETIEFLAKSGIEGSVIHGHEWMKEEIFFPGMSDTEGYLLLRDCCGDREKPFTFQQFQDALDRNKPLPEKNDDVFYQSCFAKRKPGGLILGHESGL